MIKGAIFDVDGTLFDSMYVWDTVGGEYLKSLGVEPKPDINERFKTMTLRNAALYYRYEYGVTLSVDELMDGVNKMVEKYYFNEVKLKNGVADFVKCLSDKGVKMAVATATDEYLVDEAMKRCGIRKYFGKIFTCSQVKCGKNKPTIYREALKSIGTLKSETIVFEDMLFALETAKNDGFLTAGIYDTHENNPLIMEKTADFYLKDYCDFNEFWEKSLNL